MSFFKSLLLAIFATILLTYALGAGFFELLDIDIYMGHEHIEPLKAISISALVIVLLVLAAFAVVLSVFGSIILIVMLSLGAVGMVMIGIFWPVLLVALVIWVVTKDKRKQQLN